MTEMFNWLSALQKEVRRGNEEEALYWAFELIEGGFFSHLVNRLRGHRGGESFSPSFCSAMLDGCERMV